MTKSIEQILTPSELFSIFWLRRRMWLAPTIAGVVVGVFCALTTSTKWEASQALIVRQEASGAQHERPGNFSNMEEMKKVQETILEIAKSRSVLQRTLEAIGPPPSILRKSKWPTDSDVESLRRNIRMTPPGGAEFGLTEVVYLAVRSTSRQRALRLVTELCAQLEARCMQVRDDRAQSMITELQKTVSLAEEDLEKVTTELAKFEASVGADLTELRMLLDSPSGTSDLRQKLVAMENARQEYAAQMQQQQQLLRMLDDAKRDPQALIATPNSLLDAQPALRRLKEGLIEVQLVTSRLLGRRSSRHPEVIAAKHAVHEVEESLREELETAIRGVEVDLQISTDRKHAVEAEIAKDRGRLARLAALRARYANLVALTENHNLLLEQTRAHLADAYASQASARAASLIGRIDAPHTGTTPVGPGKSVILAAGAAGGFALGLALVFLAGASTPVGTNPVLEVRSETVLTPQFAASVKRHSLNLDAPAKSESEFAGPRDAFRGMTLRQAMEQVRRRESGSSVPSWRVAEEVAAN